MEGGLKARSWRARMLALHFQDRIFMESNCTDEVIQLHHFFEEWLDGTLAKTRANYERLTAVMNPQFQIISPDGKTTAYEGLLAELWQAQHSRPGFRLWVKEVAVRPLSPQLALATYEEWQEIEGKVTARVSTAVFRQQANTPNGVEWLHVHETWLDVKGET
jgi:hypothetical protein